jgi:hypothetical protein
LYKRKREGNEKMKIVLVIGLLLLTTQATIIPHLGKAVPLETPEFQLNLDLAPEDRWTEIVKVYNDKLWDVYTVLNWLIPSSFDPYFEGLAFWGKYMFKYQEMSREIQGIANTAKIPFGKLFFVNFMYEFSTTPLGVPACSSVVVRNATNNILHGRNMDFFFWNRLSRVQAKIQFYRAGQYVATIYTYVGSVWALTTVKEYAFSITVDTRHPRADEETFSGVIDNLFVKNYMPSVWLVREASLLDNDFAAARLRLLSVNITAPVYFIIAGLSGNEGTVIERKDTGPHAYYDLNETVWYLVQTNYDRDVEDPVFDRRRIPAEDRLNKLGQSITSLDLYNDIMTQWPTFNVGTIMTLSSVPSLGVNKVVVWYGTLNQTATSSYLRN